jgi:hypothetical protein
MLVTGIDGRAYQPAAPVCSGAPFGPSEGSRRKPPVAYSQSFWFSIEISIGGL